MLTSSSPDVFVYRSIFIFYFLSLCLSWSFLWREARTFHNLVYFPIKLFFFFNKYVCLIIKWSNGVIWMDLAWAVKCTTGCMVIVFRPNINYNLYAWPKNNYSNSYTYNIYELLTMCTLSPKKKKIKSLGLRKTNLNTWFINYIFATKKNS